MKRVANEVTKQSITNTGEFIFSRSLIRSRRGTEQTREEFCIQYMENNRATWDYTSDREFQMFVECANYIGQLNLQRYTHR